MSSSTNPEKLVYLQNGVFKRKEMSNGLQYYMNSSFSTIALPPTNGTYMISLQDNTLSLVESSGTGGGEEGEITGTLDNSHFQTSDGNALTIHANGTIPYFTTNSKFAGLDFPTSGTHVLVTNGDTSAPTWTQLRTISICSPIGTPPQVIIEHWHYQTHQAIICYVTNH